jgi:hypothetical protein
VVAVVFGAVGRGAVGGGADGGGGGGRFVGGALVGGALVGGELVGGPRFVVGRAAMVVVELVGAAVVGVVAGAALVENADSFSGGSVKFTPVTVQWAPSLAICTAPPAGTFTGKPGDWGPSGASRICPPPGKPTVVTGPPPPTTTTRTWPSAFPMPAPG